MRFTWPGRQFPHLGDPRPAFAGPRRPAAGPDLSAQLARLDADSPSIASIDPPATTRPSTTGAATSAAPAPSFAGGDPISRLPPLAQAKFRALKAAHDELWAAIGALSDRRDALHRRRADLRGHAERHEAAARTRFPASPSEVADNRAALDAVAEDLAALGEQMQRLQARQTRLVQTTIPAWLRALPADAVIADHPVKAPVLKPGETPQAAVERIRERLAELAADLHEVRSAPLPSSGVKARMAAQVERLAAAGAPNVLSAIEIGRDVIFPTAQVHTGMPFPVKVDLALPFLCWLHKDEVIARLSAEIDELADDDAALDDVERGKREAAIEADILAVERTEEALITVAEAGGTEVVRRDDASPAAILGVVVITRPARP